MAADAVPAMRWVMVSRWVVWEDVPIKTSVVNSAFSHSGATTPPTAVMTSAVSQGGIDRSCRPRATIKEKTTPSVTTTPE
jgi:hypothetical protein